MNNNSSKSTINLKALALELYSNMGEISAYRKTLDGFERACYQLGIEPSTFKPGRDYQIPTESKEMWMFLIQNIHAIEGKPSKNQYVNFIEDLKDTKEFFDAQHSDLENDTVDSKAFNDSMTLMYEMFYTSSSYGRSLAMSFQNEIQQRIKEDLDYIFNNSPDDRLVLNIEFYCQQVSKKAHEIGKLTRKMIREKWNEK